MINGTAGRAPRPQPSVIVRPSEVSSGHHHHRQHSTSPWLLTSPRSERRRCVSEQARTCWLWHQLAKPTPGSSASPCVSLTKLGRDSAECVYLMCVCVCASLSTTQKRPTVYFRPLNSARAFSLSVDGGNCIARFPDVCVVMCFWMDFAIIWNGGLKWNFCWNVLSLLKMILSLCYVINDRIIYIIYIIYIIIINTEIFNSIAFCLHNLLITVS